MSTTPRERTGKRVLEHLKARYSPLRFMIDSEDAPLPGSVADIFAIHKRASPSLGFSVDGVVVVSHFFTADEIEFDRPEGCARARAACRAPVVHDRTRVTHFARREPDARERAPTCPFLSSILGPRRSDMCRLRHN